MNRRGRMLERIKFRVIYVSSEQPGFAGSELERHGPTVNGWKSAKTDGPIYPQELILHLESRARLGHMQLLIHQYLIPEKIEIFIGESIGDGSVDNMNNQLVSLESLKFILLGHVTMSTNLNTAYKVRELKSVSMECTGSFMRLLFYSNYPNKYNPCNQVSLVALNVLGEKLDVEDLSSGYSHESMSRSMGRITFQETSQSDRDRNLFSPYDDLAFTMYVDTEVQSLVKKLESKKQEAVLDERFDFASKLKSAMEHLRKSGEVLAKYQLEKQVAISREDFQRAKEKKIQMDTYRENLYKSLRIKELLEPNGRLPENDVPGKVAVNGALSGMTRSLTELGLTGPQPSNLSAASTPESTTSDSRFCSSSRLTTPESNMDKKQDSGYYSLDEPKFPPPLYVKKRNRPIDRVEKELKEEIRRVETTKLETPPPQMLCLRPSNMSERAKRYAALPISVFGEAIVEKIFSKNFAVKEDGLRNLLKAVSDYKRGDKNNPPSKILRSAMILLQRTIKDTIFCVFHFTVQVLTYLLDDFARKHRLPGSEIGQTLERILPELLAKSGDSALGKNKVASECILKLQSCQHIRNLNIISVNLIKPFDIPVHQRLAQSKAEMVEELLNNYGISVDKNAGMTPRDYTEFGVSAINQPSEHVRRVGERILIKLYYKHPKLVRQHLPLEEDISPKNIQYRILFQQFEKIDKERQDGTSSLNAIMKETKSANPMTGSVYIPKT